jgi:small conductance mechanosensitive channel
MGDQLKVLDQVTTTGIDLAVKFGPRLLVAILILVAGHFVGGWAARATSRMLSRFHLEPPVSALIERAVRILVFGLFFIVALQNLGVELLPLIAGLSVAGAGIALAAQGVLGNVVAGLTIIFTRPFRVGDYVSIAKEEGQVLAIDLFSTTLGHADLSKIVIPNRKIVGEILHNYGRLRQLTIEVGIAYGADIGAALQEVQQVLARNPRVLKDPAPGIAVTRLADSCIVLAACPWVGVADYGAASGEIPRAIAETFRARGIAIPFPQREVRMLT